MMRFCFAEAPLGRLRRLPHERRGRHCHDDAFAAIVLSGGYQEAGDEGRWNVRPGDVLLHRAFESHLDRFEASGAEALILPVPPTLASAVCVKGVVADPDAVARLAESDRSAAGALLAETFASRPTVPLDWPDVLAGDLRRRRSFALGDWAETAGLRAETLSRGFRAAYDCTPKVYRAQARTRAALAALVEGDDPIAAIAHDLRFSDQAHMTRAVVALTGSPPGRWRIRSNGFNRHAGARPIDG